MERLTYEEGINLAVEANMGLVGEVARRYQERGLDWDDLMQEGSIGLKTGLERFDPAKGVQISTYVFQWIRRSISLATDNLARTIRVPVPTLRLEGKLSRMTGDFEADCDKLGVTRKMRGLLKARAKNVTADVDLSFVCERDGDRDDGPDLERLYAALDELSPTDRELLAARFGLDGREPSTLVAIGRGCGVTKERVRQRQNEALARLRAILEPSAPAVETRPCARCGGLVIRGQDERPGKWADRQFCGRSCAGAAYWEAVRATGEAAAVGA